MYEIKFLSNKDFDRLPKEVTRGSDISDSLGFYNPHLSRAYIRYTAYPELNKYLLNHEFEHMLEGDATDVDENGIRHKKFFKEIFLPIITGGLVSGGTRGGVFNLGREQDKFDPLGFLGPLSGAFQGRGRTEDAKRAQEQQAELESQRASQFEEQNRFFQNFLRTQPVSSGQSQFGGNPPAGDQISSLGGLNQPLNQGGNNPFAQQDDRFRYGAPVGRLRF